MSVSQPLPSPSLPGSCDRARIAVLMATFNRPELTADALHALALSAEHAGVSVKLFLADASTNELTKRSIAGIFPDAETIRVSDDSYWANSMRIAWEHAQHWDHDFVMWLNDDVTLERKALSCLIESSVNGPAASVAVGATRDPATGEMTYGGKLHGPWFAPLHGPRLLPTDRAQKIGIIEGNIVLIPKTVDDAVGGFPSGYLHNMADTAYGLRVKKKEIKVLLCPGFLGTCSANPAGELWRDTSLPAKTRWAHLSSPKGRPFRYWFKLCREIGGVTWPLYLLSGHARVLASFLKVGTWKNGHQKTMKAQQCDAESSPGKI